MNPNRKKHASLLADPVLRPQEVMVLEVLRADESLQIDEILELLETQLTSSEVFTALFELEITGRIRQLPGKELCAHPVRFFRVEHLMRCRGFARIIRTSARICA